MTTYFCTSVDDSFFPPTDGGFRLCRKTVAPWVALCGMNNGAVHIGSIDRNELHALRVAHSLYVEVAERKSPRTLAPGDQLIVASVRGLPERFRLPTLQEAEAASYSFSIWTVVETAEEEKK